jgi:flagellar hook-basal body complex protein FliE
MDDLSIKNVLSSPIGRTRNDEPVSRDPLSDFKNALNHSIQEVNGLLNQADEQAQGMALGKTDIHEAMMALEEAHVSLRMLIQVRNKIIAAYEEMMRMQL